jgi:sensor histidine kinase regulating citrate/malate metabolism
MGMAVVGVSVLGTSALLLLTGDTFPVLAFSFGASTLALFAKAGGGIFTKTADISADLVGKVELGIPEEHRERIFTRFYRSDEARERSRTGFGIGLTVVKEIVEQQGGTVSFRDNDPEPGTTFIVRLPQVRKRSRV